MEGPLAGVRVLEVANWYAAPAGCALMADLGADVIKVEPPGGEALRGFLTMGADLSYNFVFELPNRGKRGMTLNLAAPKAREVIDRLLPGTDVFVTNLLPYRREKYGLTYGELIEHRPDLIYVSLTGYGSTGPDRNRPGYDYAAFWARSGIMNSLGEPGDPPPPQRPAMGDMTNALVAAGSVAMALLARDRTGEGQEVDISLQNTGIWVLSGDLQGALHGVDSPKPSRREMPNPLWNSYRTKDDRWIQLVMLVPDMYWPQFCLAIEREELEKDDRFATFQSRGANREELIAILDDVFAGRTLEEWDKALDEHGIIWAPAQTLTEVVNDPQARARGAFAKMEHPNAGEVEIVNTPVKFGKSEVGVRGPAPEVGQHTEEVLLEAGFDWDDILKLRDDSVI
jgi:formyl-CoA transferase